MYHHDYDQLARIKAEVLAAEDSAVMTEVSYLEDVHHNQNVEREELCSKQS